MCSHMQKYNTYMRFDKFGKLSNTKSYPICELWIHSLCQKKLHDSLWTRLSCIVDGCTSPLQKNRPPYCLQCQELSAIQYVLNTSSLTKLGLQYNDKNTSQYITTMEHCGTNNIQIVKEYHHHLPENTQSHTLSSRDTNKHRVLTHSNTRLTQFLFLFDQSTIQKRWETVSMCKPMQKYNRYMRYDKFGNLSNTKSYLICELWIHSLCQKKLHGSLWTRLSYIVHGCFAPLENHRPPYCFQCQVVSSI